MKKTLLINKAEALIKMLQNSKAALEQQKVSNTLSEEAASQIDAAIAEKQALIDTMQQIKDDATAAEGDETEAALAKIKELQDKVTKMENSKKEVPAAVKIKNFINSREAAKEFQKVIKNSRDKASFLEAWNAVLVKNNISPTASMLPGAVVSVITDTWEKTADGFMSILDVTGLNVLKSLLDTNTDATYSRAQGHTKGAQKNEQSLIFTPLELRPQIIYKYIKIDRETELEDENGVLINYIAKELVSRIINEIMRCVLIGDGRTGANHINKFVSVARSTTDAYVTVSTSAARIATIDEVKEMIDSIDADGDIYLFVSKKQCTELQKFIGATGGTTQYKAIDILAGELGVKGIFKTKMMTASAAADPIAVAFVGKSYKVVGNLNTAGFEDFNLAYNQKEYLTEVYAGGGLIDANSGACLLAGV